MPLTGKSDTIGLAFYSGNPASASTSSFDVPLGTLVLDTTNGVLYQKILALGTNTAGYARVITGQAGAIGTAETKFCTTQLDAASSTTLANVTGLTGFTLTAAGVYAFDIALAGTATSNGGWKVAFKYTTATLTDLESSAIGATASSLVTQHTTTATDQASLLASTTAIIYGRISGRITVNAGGTLAVQFAQNASHADTSSIYVGSWAKLTRIS